MATALPNPQRPMKELLEDYPSARRALFAAFHIGGCQSCAFSEEDSLAQVCQEHELDVQAACETIARSHEDEQKLLLSPEAVKEKLASKTPPVLVDTRTREEHEAVCLEGSMLLTENTLSNLSTKNEEQEIVLYDHTGSAVLDHVSWFRGHGLKRTFALAGGIDAYAQEVDSSLARYRLELDSADSSANSELSKGP
jgi:rhodanese-related sulfurtransferase